MHRLRRHLLLSLAVWALSTAPAGAEDDPPDEDDDDSVVVEGRHAALATSGPTVTAIEVDERLPESADVADAIARSPGASVRRLGGLGSYAAVSLRGSALRQVEVHLDGIPLNPDGSAAVNLAELPLRALDRVEVWRGGGPAWLAAAPLGGVVNLVTRDGGAAPLSLAAGFGGWGTLTAGASGTTVVDGTEVLASATGLSTVGDFVYFDDNGTDGVLTDDLLGRRESNDKHQLGAVLRIRRAQQRGTLTGLAVATLREEGLPGPIGAGADGRLRTRWGLAAIDRIALRGATRLRGRAWAQGRDERLTPTLASGAAASTELQARVGIHGELRHAVTERLVVGGAARLRHDARAATDARSEAASRWTGTLAGDAGVWLGPDLRVEPVLHGQLWLDRSAGEQRVRALASPRISAAWQAHDQVVLHAAFGRAARPPDFLELFGDRGAVVGRADLRPERGTWADAGMRLVGEGAGAELAVFHHAAVDRIVFVQNGQRTLVPINVGRSRVSGLELAFDLDALGFVDARAAATLTHSVVRNDQVPGLDGRRLPRVPVAGSTVDLGLRWRQRARLAWQLDAIAGNAWDEANRTVAAPRILHGVALRVRPGPAWPALTLEVRNLLDTRVQAMPLDPVRPDGARALRPITDFTGYPLPGRTGLVTLRWTPDEASP